MTGSLNYQERKQQMIKLATAKSYIAAGEKRQPMNFQNDQQVPALDSPEKDSPEKRPVPDNVHPNGSLPYFHFYLDEVVQSANVVESAEKRQPMSTTALLSTGFVAATVVSGLLIGDALKPTAPPNATIPPLKPKQRVAVLLPRPTSVAPEKLKAPRFVSRSQRESQPPAVPQSAAAPRQNSVDRAAPQSFAPLLPSVTLAAVPELLPVSRSLPPKRTVTGAPAPAGMKPLVRPAYQDLPDLQRPPQTPLTALNSPPAAIRETIPAAIAAPEQINSGQSGQSGQSTVAIPTPVAPAQPAAALPKPLPLPPAQPSSESSPATPPQTENQPTEPKPSKAEPTIPATEPPPLNSTSSTIESPMSNSAGFEEGK
ncbi:hypothetical protein AB3R30_15580 [Leptolyngbyaceae cyanobacterium UHCC 1019]